MAAKMSFELAKQQSERLEKVISQLRQQVLALVSKVEKEESSKIEAENSILKNEIFKLKEDLVNKEIENGIQQVVLPVQQSVAVEAVAPVKPPAPQENPPTATASPAGQPKKKKEKKEKPAGGKNTAAAAAEERAVDVSRISLRVGHIQEAIKHPDADGLYVETVELGEARPRTIVSGLVNHVTLEQMQDRLAIFMTNLKPAKMRGILSEGMIMCASTPEKVEILNCPPGAKFGDAVTVEEFPGEPDALLNPKKKIWEQVAPDLQVDANGVACYKGRPLVISGKGKVTAPSMCNCQVK